MSSVGFRNSRRGAVLSTPRTARAFAVSKHEGTLLVGTSKPRGGNRLQLLNCGSGGDSLSPERAYACDEEIWGCASLLSQDRAHVVAVACRHGASSSMAVWRLPPARRPLSERLSLGGDASEGVIFPVVGPPEVLATIRCPGGKAKGVIVSSSESVVFYSAQHVAVVTIDTAHASASITRSLPVSDPVVAVDFCDAYSAVLVATGNTLYLHDVRSQSRNPVPVLSAESVAETSVRGPGESKRDPGLCLLPRQPRFCSVSAGISNVIAAGNEDGGLCCADIRAGSKSALWAVDDRVAHSHWVSSIGIGPGDVVASGGTDGVARAWSADGNAVGTYPVHDEAVYGVAWLTTGGFASCSYDGRVSLNARPVGVD